VKVLVVSKALVSAAYRRKLREIARLGVDLVAVVPEEWKEGSGQRFEREEDPSYRVIVTRLRLNGRFHLHYYPELSRILGRESPDLLHVDEEPYNAATFLATRSASRHSTPSIFFTWQNIPRSYPPPFRQMESWVYRASALALAGSYEAERVLRLKGFMGPVQVVPQFGVDPEVFVPGAAPSGPFTVGFFNRLVPAKGPLIALKAFALLPPDARLLMVGDGPLRDQIRREIAQRGLQSRVELRSRVPSEEVPELLRSVHVSILPSLSTPSWKEQFGRVLIESMASGVPVVGSSSGEIPQVIGEAGIVVPEGDADRLGKALLSLCGDPSLRRDLAERGRRRVLEHYTQAQIAEQTVAAYRQAVQRKN
jgi:glycosyltransferase involved in cell wall biosynthesis